ncbi:MAG: tRNA (guanosine(37)-N1)-methyltransferase TrmD [Syntrophobacterales bacterium]|nr:tRNA (guanosine(37)-N1)-methyltransferase TrmD [Syntrophobacterales bacterium]
MRIDLLTLFPDFFAGPLTQSILRRAQEQGAVSFRVINLRDFTTDRHRTADDRPFGGGPGMVLKLEPLVAAIRAVRAEDAAVWVVLLSPAGGLLTQKKVRELAARSHLLLVCGHYEGVDDRLAHYVDEELSIGDYVLTGGEPAAVVVADAVVRLLPAVLGCEGSAAEESFQTGLLDHPHYTRPRVFEGHAVPEILLSGDHAAVARWRRQEALRRTLRRRPDLLARAALTPADRDFLARLREISEQQDG